MTKLKNSKSDKTLKKNVTKVKFDKTQNETNQKKCEKKCDKTQKI